ncbi:hypothetical protein [Streptomyces sp. NPDC005533]|uniref:hypothetical protein n=1 Tax=Streptomyces sp. NPDC005533 TaxID=3364723 RepID=UPI0036AB2D80
MGPVLIEVDAEQGVVVGQGAKGDGMAVEVPAAVEQPAEEAIEQVPLSLRVPVADVPPMSVVGLRAG